ncbi:MAG TPA: hypothetical protein VNF06_03190 [Candidatus Aquilonibacter sp.]|nr:hypothetical protein [Candidatus Aquilonibacter sp.]
MDEKITVKAPGKILWLGGYSVIEKPNISYTTTVDAFVHATIKPIREKEVVISVPQFGQVYRSEVDLHTGKLANEAPQELALIKTAVEIGVAYAIGLGHAARGFEIETKNDEPLLYKINPHTKKLSKSGLGSSAAVTVATIGAVLSEFEVDLGEKEVVHKLAQLAHSIATGKVGSGFDIAAATYGSIIYSRYSPEVLSKFREENIVEDVHRIVKHKWDHHIEPLEMPSQFKLSMATFFDESAVTVSLLGKVNELKASNPEKYYEIIDRINQENVSALSSLRKIATEQESAENLEKFRDHFDNGRILTKQLGEASGAQIEPDEATTLIEESKRNGAFVAKLPGAGGRDSITALSTDAALSKKVREFFSKQSMLEMLNVNFQHRGFSVVTDREKRGKTLMAT